MKGIAMTQNQIDKIEEIIIIFNGREKVVIEEFLTFEDVVRYSFDNPPTGETVDFSIQFTNGHPENPSGSHRRGGHKVKVKHRMEFVVTPTNRS